MRPSSTCHREAGIDLYIDIRIVALDAFDARALIFNDKMNFPTDLVLLHRYTTERTILTACRRGAALHIAKVKASLISHGIQ